MPFPFLLVRRASAAKRCAANGFDARVRRRRLAECLEPRRLLAGDAAFSQILPTAEQVGFGQVMLNNQGRQICPAFTSALSSSALSASAIDGALISAAEGEQPQSAGSVDVTAAIVQPAGPLAPGAAFGSAITFENLGPNAADGTNLTVGFDANLANVTWQRTVTPAQAATVDVLSLDGGDGLAVNGINSLDLAGFSVSGGGDFNGDGIDDFLIGVPEADDLLTTRGGSGYVVFGTATGFPSELNLSSLDGSNGFALDGNGDRANLGVSIDSAGDVNNDGIDDLIVGAPGADPGGANDAGEVYVVFGSTATFPAAVDPGTLNGTNGFVLSGLTAGSFLGVDVAAAGDVSGDGIDDLIVGASGTSAQGAAYVVFGRNAATTPFVAAVDLTSLDGSDGFALTTTISDAELGWAVDGAGDINNDGVDDLIVGAIQRGDDSGAAYVIFGKSTAFSATLNADSLGSDGFTIDNPRANHNFGFDVSGLGDINGDSIDDLIVVDGIDAVGTDAARGYVLFGSGSAFPTTVDVSGLDGTTGITINAPAVDHPSQMVVSGGGDLNGDGINDLLIGLPEGQVIDAGTTTNFDGGGYVVFGSSSLTNPFDLGSVDGTSGFLIDGGSVLDQAGFSIGLAGDVNDDGFDDVIVGAPFAAPGGQPESGTSYVVFGRGVTTGSGSGSIDETFDLDPGDRVVYEVAANIAAAATVSTTVTATANLAAGHTDTNPGDNTATATTTIQGLAPEVASIEINDGGISRSQITSVTVTFNTEVDLAALQSAFTLTNIDTSTGVTSLVVDATNGGGITTAVLTFGSGPSVVARGPVLGNSLADGNYRLDIAASQVQAGGSTMAAEYVFGGQNAAVPASENDNFFRLYGDADGDGDVDLDDLFDYFSPSLFALSTQPNYNPSLDAEGDGDIDLDDLFDHFSPNLFAIRQ